MPRFEYRYVRTPRSIWQWILRVIGGLAFGYMMCGLAMALWFAFGALCYGSSDFMNNDLKSREGMPYFFMGFTSSVAAGVGSAAGMLFLGMPNGRWRNPTLVCCVVSGFLSAVLGAWLGFSLGLLPEMIPVADRKPLIYAIFLLAVPAGVLGGWLAARRITKRIVVAFPEDMIEREET